MIDQLQKENGRFLMEGNYDIDLFPHQEIPKTDSAHCKRSENSTTHEVR